MSIDLSKGTSKNGWIVFLASGAGVGFLPRCPGTIGTLLAVPVAVGINQIAFFSLMAAILLVAALIGVSVWLAGRAAARLGQIDPRQVVIDEVAGFLVAYFYSPMRLAPLLLAFLLFRTFDIAKLFPIAKLERLPGGYGIVLDDVMAGFYTFCILRLVFWLGIL